MDFEIDALDHTRARAEARARLFASPERVTLGRYELVNRIGAGSWGTVYEAHDPLMSRRVAVKVLHGHVEEGLHALDRWRREAQLLAKLEHPNVIGVYDVGVDAGRAYLVTQLVHGGRTLTQWLATTPNDLTTLLRGFVALADALSALHGCGILHRDIKPDNILVDPDGIFQLADFGLAREPLGPAHHEPSIRFEGTPAYLPPEVRDGAAPDERADVYSLCASLWFAACGVPSPQGVPPRSLRRMFRIGLAATATARFNTALEFHAALESVCREGVPWPQVVAPLGFSLLAALAVLSPATQASTPDEQVLLVRAHDASRDDVLGRIAKLHAAKRYDRASALALESIRSAASPETRVELELALGRARYANGAQESAVHVLESAFFRACASASANLASEAALLLLEIAVGAAELQNAEVWDTEAGVWFSRRTATDLSLGFRLATARSKRLMQLGRPQEALRALPDAGAPPGVSPANVIEFLFQRGQLLNQLGENEDGLRTFAAANELATRHFPAEHNLRRSALWNLAVSQFEQGDFATAARGFEGLLETDNENAGPPLGEVAELQRNLGGLYFELGDIRRALVHTEAALIASQAAYGDTHPTTLDTLGNLAAILHADGQPDAAQAASWRALIAAETEYGPEHPALVPILNNLAVMSNADADGDEAEALLRRAEAIVETHRGPQHREMALVQTNLARMFSLRGQSDAALEAATLALGLYESSLGPDHPELAEALLLVAASMLDGGQYESARAHALRARALPSVPIGRRARAAFLLAQIDAHEHPQRRPGAWLATAAAELERSPQDLNSEFARALARWQLDSRAQAAQPRR